MFMIVEQGGFQFKVSQGDTIRVPLINAEKGQEVTLDKVLLISDGEAVTVGTPVVAGAQAKATVLEHGKGDKVLIIKKRRREDYKRKNGHRQDFTKLQITALAV
ncbi:MAG: 50S ribosomal protein L21 [Chitinivibrionales bacterium]|nr:50S ribosomal protein L21 [Chitinivibrionales bacterium]